MHLPGDTRIRLKQCRTLLDAGYEVHLLSGGSDPLPPDGLRFHSISADPGRPPLRDQPPRYRRLARRARELDADLYHLHDPHLIPLGLELQQRGARVVYDVHEHYPLKALGRREYTAARRHAKALSWRIAEAAARNRFDGFVCASSAVASRFPDERTIVLNNFPSLREFAGFGAPAPERPPVALYVGWMRESRGFFELIDVPAHLAERHGVRLRIVGGVRPPGLADRVGALPWSDRIEMLGPQSRERTLAALRTATLGIAMERPRFNAFEGWRMNKLFEYMAAGLPVVMPDAPRWTEIIDRFGCGVAARIDDPRSIAAAIDGLASDPGRAAELGRSGRRAVLEELNWERQAPRLLSLYSRLVGRPPAVEVPPTVRDLEAELDEPGPAEVVGQE